jgi:hypothetical protein
MAIAAIIALLPPLDDDEEDDVHASVPSSCVSTPNEACAMTSGSGGLKCGFEECEEPAVMTGSADAANDASAAVTDVASLLATGSALRCLAAKRRTAAAHAIAERMGM